MGWKRIRIPERHFDKDRERLLQQFYEWCNQHEHPDDAVLYEDPLGSTAGRSLYLTPKAAEIAGDDLASWGAEDCEPPDTSKMNPHACWK